MYMTGNLYGGGDNPKVEYLKTLAKSGVSLGNTGSTVINVNSDKTTTI